MTAPRRDRPFQFQLRTLFILTAVVAVFLAAYAWWDRAMGGFMLGYIGPVENRERWPLPLKTLFDKHGEIPYNESTIQIFCLTSAEFEHVWRMDAAPGVFEEIERQWALTKTNDPQLYKLEGYRSHMSGITTPEWWTPNDDGNTSFFVSPQVLVPGRSDHFYVALDKKRNTIFVYYWFDF